jgi:hypothetical protein
MPGTVARAAREGDWTEVGRAAAIIGTAGAFGATAIRGLAMAMAALGRAGPPLAMTTFILAARAAFGDRLSLICLGHPDPVESILADWLCAGRDGFAPSDTPPASATYCRDADGRLFDPSTETGRLGRARPSVRRRRRQP